MASTDELKRQIDCHELAERLGLERVKGGNYRSPHHDDRNPSLSIYSDGKRWKDWSSPETGGSCIDLVMYVQGLEVDEAIRWLHDAYGIARSAPLNGQPREKTRAEWIWARCRGDATPAVDWLEGRGIPREVTEACVKRGTIGYNVWHSDTRAAGEAGHGGPAVAFAGMRPETREIACVSMRYLDPELNGGVKEQSQGDKKGAAWSPSWRDVDAARVVYITDGQTDALTAQACGIPKSGAIASLGNTNEIDWSFLAGKKAVLVPDADPPDRFNRCAGREWAWRVHDALTALNVSTQIIDLDAWYEAGIKDLNECLQAEGLEETKYALKRLEPWIIAGMPGKEHPGRSRLFLPGHDFAQYWRYRHKEDFVTYIKRAGEEDADGEGKGPEYLDVCGFRPVALSRISVQSAGATMTGRSDVQPHTIFSVTAQNPRHGPELVRRVLEDEKVHNLDQWAKFGPIYSKPQFHRMINILERAADIGSRKAANYVGLCWKDGKLVVNEGSDCYFTEPDKQCHYVDLRFPRVPRREGARVLDAWRRTFRRDAASQLLVWTLGAHLKAFLGFWPHLQVQAAKGAGKSTLLHRLEAATGIQVLGGQSINTQFRILASVSHSSHPIGWEEISAQPQKIIDAAVSLLQEAYDFSITRRGTGGNTMTQYVVSAPVILSGEDVPVRSLTGKLARVSLTGRKGELLPRGLPAFPVYEWLRWLTQQSADDVAEAFEAAHAWCEKNCRATSTDDGARRMAKNYAAILTAWKLLEAFLGRDADTEFAHNLAREMNDHIGETTSDREPWVWILELIAGEISRHSYQYPYAWQRYLEEGDDVECLVIRPRDVMQHLGSSPGHRSIFDALPVKSDRVLKQQLRDAGIVHRERVDPVIDGQRHNHMIALSLERLSEFGVSVSRPQQIEIALDDAYPSSSSRPFSEQTH